MPEPIGNIKEFFAHAIEIEREAAARYREFQLHFSGRGEELLAALCGDLASQEQEHHEILLARADGLDLPRVEPGRYRWLGSGSPEAAAPELMAGVVSPRRLMQIALGAECSARRFFEHVAGTTPDPAVRCLAEEMAAEECEHEERVGRILAGLPGEGPDQEFLPRAVEGPGAAPETERFSPRAPRPASKPLY